MQAKQAKPGQATPSRVEAQAQAKAEAEARARANQCGATNVAILISVGAA